MTKGKILLIAGIMATSVVMIFFTLFLMKLPWLASDEKLLIWSTSVLKFKNREMPKTEDYALINTSFDLQLVDRYDDFGFPVGNRAITDREKLTMLLNAMASGERRPKYLLMDIHFVDSTAADSALHAAMKKFDKIILSYHLNDANQPEYPIFKDINRGLSDYVLGSVFEGVYKYQLVYNDSLKLTPLKIYQDLTGAEVTKKGPFIKVGNNWTLNNFIVNYRLAQMDIQNMDAGFNPVSMGELLFLENQDIQDFTADKIVVIGDFFEGDMHETLFEITSGPLILLNVLLTISNGDAFVSIWFFLILMAGYAYMSYMVFVEGDYMETRITKYFGAVKIASYLAGFVSYMLILTLMSLITFFFFNIHLNIFFLAVAFYLLDKIVAIIHKRINH